MTTSQETRIPVSYTHLDVYKRQACRSILLPITIDIAPSPDEYISRRDIDEAKKLADPKFGGER